MSNIVPTMFRVTTDILLWGLGSASSLYFGGSPRPRPPWSLVQPHRCLCCPWMVSLPQCRAALQPDTPASREENTLDPSLLHSFSQKSRSWWASLSSSLQFILLSPSAPYIPSCLCFLSLVVFELKPILPKHRYPYSLLVSTCMEYLFLFFHFEPMCVFKAEVNLLQAACSWMLFVFFTFDWRM